MPAALAAGLGRMGHDVETAPGEGLAGRPDGDIWTAAQDEQRFLITQDLDFSDLRKFTPGAHAGILVVRYRNPGRLALARAVIDLFTHEDVDAWAGCFVVATERKLRIRRPAP